MYIDDIYVVDMHILYYTVICLMRVQENARLPTMEKDIYNIFLLSSPAGSAKPFFLSTNHIVRRNHDTTPRVKSRRVSGALPLGQADEETLSINGAPETLAPGNHRIERQFFRTFLL